MALTRSRGLDKWACVSTKIGPSQAYRNTDVLFFVRTLCLLAWRLGAELEVPRVLPGTQAQLWYIGKRDESGFQPASLGLWMEALFTSAFSPENHASNTEGWCSDRAVQKGSQPSSGAFNPQQEERS